jgi:uncharacterized protein with FMN-binding domain
MSSSPKIVVLKTREIIYTFLLLFLVAMLIICLVLMFSGKSSGETITSEQSSEYASDTQESSTASASYVAGIYTSPVSLGSTTADVEVCVDGNHINSIRLVNLSESTQAAFPLVSPALDHLASQILLTQSLENITCPQENLYTSRLLLSAISDALSRAAVPSSDNTSL